MTNPQAVKVSIHPLADKTDLFIKYFVILIPAVMNKWPPLLRKISISLNI